MKQSDKRRCQQGSPRSHHISENGGFFPQYVSVLNSFSVILQEIRFLGTELPFFILFLNRIVILDFFRYYLVFLCPLMIQVHILVGRSFKLESRSLPDLLNLIQTNLGLSEFKEGDLHPAIRIAGGNETSQSLSFRRCAFYLLIETQSILDIPHFPAVFVFSLLV